MKLDKTLRSITELIVRCCDPDEIILFGSYAKGNAQVGSDLDILVIANFKKLPPAVPSEYLIPLYGIIISTVVGWSIPSIMGWTKSKGDAKKLNYYHKEIISLYGMVN